MCQPAELSLKIVFRTALGAGLSFLFEVSPHSLTAIYREKPFSLYSLLSDLFVYHSLPSLQLGHVVFLVPQWSLWMNRD